MLTGLKAGRLWLRGHRGHSFLLGKDLETGPASGGERPPRWFLELDPEEGVEDRVEAAVEVRERLSDEDPRLQAALKRAAVRDDAELQERVDDDAGTVGQPAGKEARHKRHSGAQRASLLHPLGAAWERDDDDAVAYQDHEAGKHEADEHVLSAERRHPCERWVHRVDALAHNARLVRAGDHLSAREHQVGRREQRRREPRAQVHHALRQQTARSLAARGVHHSEVAVQADEGEQEHAAVQVHCVHHVHKHAHEATEEPSTHRVYSPERQREHKQQVGHRQVQPVSVRHCAWLPLAPHHHHHQPVTRQPQREDHTVHRRKQNPLQVLVPLDAAWRLQISAEVSRTKISPGVIQ